MKSFIETKPLGFLLMLFVLSATALSAETYSNLLGKADLAIRETNYNLALVCARKAIGLDSNNPSAYQRLGFAFMLEKHFDKALSAANDAIRIAPIGSYASSEAYLNRGFIYCGMTNAEMALADFNRAIHISPYLPAYSYRACIYNEKELYDQALIDASMAIQLNPADKYAYVQKGYALFGLKEFKPAIQALSQVIKMSTNDTWAYSKRACAYAAIEDYPHAIADCDRLLQLNSSNADALSSRGFSFSRMGDFDAGLKDCKKAVQLDKSSDTANNNLAWLLTIAPDAKLRDGKSAVKYAKRACDLSGWTNAYCIGTLAAANAEVGNFDEAVKLEQKCLQMGLPLEKEMNQARLELDLFKQKKPYHADK